MDLKRHTPRLSFQLGVCSLFRTRRGGALDWVAHCFVSTCEA